MRVYVLDFPFISVYVMKGMKWLLGCGSATPLHAESRGLIPVIFAAKRSQLGVKHLSIQAQESC